jgi:Sec-independent protein translocase protein TatA
MFDFAWSEIMVVGVVALLVIGPKDLPAAIRAVTGMIKKARRMASEFQTHSNSTNCAILTWPVRWKSMLIQMARCEPI